MKAYTTTFSYYDNHAKQYFDNTFPISMTKQQNCFLQYVSQNGRVLDVGFGSGRDMLAFSDKGFSVDGIDVSSELTHMAEEKGLSVCCMSIQEWCDSLDVQPIENDAEKYDGIWACASILHLEEPDIHRFFHCVSKAMKKDGVLFVSVKNGIRTGLDEQGRYFTDFTEELLSEVCDENPQLALIERWESEDSMARAGFVWWNLIFRYVGEEAN